jgi:hypothetical protein
MCLVSSLLLIQLNGVQGCALVVIVLEITGSTIDANDLQIQETTGEGSALNEVMVIGDLYERYHHSANLPQTTLSQLIWSSERRKRLFSICMSRWNEESEDSELFVRIQKMRDMRRYKRED